MADGFEQTAERLEDLAIKGSRGGKAGGKRGRGGGGGGSNYGGPQNRDVQISKGLSTLLRHQAANAGIQLDDEGFANLDKVLLWPRIRSLKPVFADIQREVATNAKQRFTMKLNPAGTNEADSTDPADWLIRANQGHSIELSSEALHTAMTLEAGNVPKLVVHGTYFAFWPLILEAGGLKKMGRTHVHFGTGLPEDGAPAKIAPQVHEAGDEAAAAPEQEQGRPKVVSGMRSDAELLIFLDVEKSLKEGDMKWWLSENGVVLTEGNEEGVVPTKYFKEVRGRRQGVGELLKDGEKTADLPGDIVIKVPQNKRGGGGNGGGRGRGGGRGAKRGDRGS